MKKLNQYILEKLKIDKHVNIEPEIIFEKMLFLTLFYCKIRYI